MGKVSYSVIRTARDGIDKLDRIRQEQNLTQAAWSRKAGYDEFGKLVSNTYNRGNCKLSVMAQLLKPLGYELIIVKTEGKHDGETDTF